MYRLLILLIFLTSCGGLTPNRMFKTPSNYEFARDTTNLTKPIVYFIQPGDKVDMHIYSNNGFKLVDITQYDTESGTSTSTVPFTIDVDSTAKFPILGRIKLAGLSVREVEKKLEESYSKYFNDPFIVISVINRTAIVFLNETGHGAVVHLENENTTLYEALALAGGIGEYSKSYSIKILRGDPRNPQIFKADISTVEGLQTSELRVLSNDIIYIDSGARFTKRISTDILPILGLISTLFLLTTYITK